MVSRVTWAIWPQLGNRLLGNVTNDLRGLLLPHYQRDLVCAHRASLIINRVRLIAALFAVLTPLWIILDIISFPVEIWLQLAAARLLVSGCFILLSLMYHRSDQALHAYMAIALMFLIPSLFFFYSHFVFTHTDAVFDDFAVTFLTGYAFLPFVMATGLSVFPLTALEGMVFATPTLLLEIFVGQGFGSTLISADAHLGLIWLLVLVSGVAVLASMGQLHFLSEIVYKSSHDPLTQAFNRLTGEEMMERYYLLSKRNNTPLSIIFVDIDNFKAINDSYGHEAGDQVLKDAAWSIIRAIRREDLLIRWGGEEFVIVLPHTFEKGCVEMNLRVCRSGLGKRPDGTPLTASLGMAEVLKDKVESLGELVDLADRRMYRAKQSGKNRICFGEGVDDISEEGIFS